MRIVSVSCRQDNYAYLLICEKTNETVVVDPSEAEPVLAALKAEDLDVRAVWNTHHHYDHVEGNTAVVENYSGVEVIAHESDKGRVPGQTQFVSDGDRLTVGEEISGEVIFNPGHTSGAISFYLEEQAALFTGDTLFGAGCGRLFEGTAEKMHGSLLRLVALPGDTKVYCGHEYTQANLAFAKAVEPGNKEIAARAEEVAQARKFAKSTMGFSIAQELATNVFVRCTEAEVVASAQAHGLEGDNPEDVFFALRQWKDGF